MQHKSELVHAAMHGVKKYLESDEGTKHFDKCKVNMSDNGEGFTVYHVGARGTVYVHFLTVELGELK